MQTCPGYDTRFGHYSSGQLVRALGFYGTSPCLPTVNHMEAPETAVKYRARQQVLLVTPAVAKATPTNTAAIRQHSRIPTRYRTEVVYVCVFYKYSQDGRKDKCQLIIVYITSADAV